MDQFLSKAAIDILSERQRQLKVYTPEHDDVQVDGQLSRAAAAYAVAGIGHLRRGQGAPHKVGP